MLPILTPGTAETALFVWKLNLFQLSPSCLVYIYLALFKAYRDYILSLSLEDSFCSLVLQSNTKIELNE